jgi:uncharacterized membrane protein YagU involved in acid resistance
MPATKTILKAALIVGTLDILAACTQFYFKTGKTPFKPVLTFVASGLVGKEAFTNGDMMMLAGLVIHYCIATAFTFFFFYTVARLSFAREHKLLTGILYGAFVWMVMNLLVLPLTNANRLPKTFWSVTIGMLILICCIGIPLAYLASRNYYASRKHHRTLKNFLQ